MLEFNFLLINVMFNNCISGLNNISIIIFKIQRGKYHVFV